MFTSIRKGLCLAMILAASLVYSVPEAKGQHQQYDILFRGKPMDAALEELVRLTSIDLVYSNELIKGKRVYCSKREASAESLLRCILDNSGLDFIRSSAGTYVLIEALQKKPLFGDLAGSITDLETGDPLPYANILLADGTSGTTSNQDGFFSFKSLLTGAHEVVVTYVGYETTVDSIWVEPGEKSRVTIGLKSSNNSVGPIVIDGLEQRLPSNALGRSSLRGASLMEVSSLGTPDVMRGASQLSGVSVQQPVAGIQIQGGLSNEHVTMLDGAPVRDPVTLGRYLGAFSPLALSRLTVYKAGYGAQHGSHLTGFVTLDQDLYTIEPYSASLMLDPVSINGQVKGRFKLANEKEGTVMGAVRTSTWDVYQDRSVHALLKNWNGLDPFLTRLWSQESVSLSSLTNHSQNPLVSFSDVHFASRLKLSPFHNINGSFYRASNRIESNVVATNDLRNEINDLFVITDDRYSWLNWAGQLKHSWLIDSRSAISTQIKGSWHNSNYSYRALNGTIEDQPSSSLIDQTAASYKDALANTLSSFEKNFIRELTFSSTFSHSFSPFHHTDIGIEATHVATEFDFKNNFVDTLRHDINTSNIAGFIQDQIALNAFFSIEPSIRLTYLPVRSQVYAEPRLALRLDNVHPTMGNYALRLAGGIYRQYINQYDLTSLGATSAAPSILFWLPLDESLAPPRSYHLAFEALLTPGRHWTLGLETFAKWQRVLTLDYANLQSLSVLTAGGQSVSQDLFISSAKGTTLGSSLQIKRSGSFLGLGASYDYIKAIQQFPDRFNNEQVAVPWHSPHRLTFDVKANLTENLFIEANWVSQWGRQWALRRAYYDYLSFRSLPVSIDPIDLTTPTNHETPAYQRLDIGAGFKITSNRISSNLRLYVINVLGRDNVYDQALSVTSYSSSIAPRTLPGRQVTLSLRVDY